jgi:hypothetical protein
MNLVRAILLKIASALLFALMQALVRWLGDAIPLGQVVFYRSAFAILPVVVIFAWRGELAAAVRTSRPFGQAWRGTISVAGMFLISPRWRGCRWWTRPPFRSRLR